MALPISPQGSMAKTVSVVRDKTRKPTLLSKVASAFQQPGSGAPIGPKALDNNRDAWANALTDMSAVRTPDPLTAFAKVAGMGFAGYNQGKAVRQKEQGSAAFKQKLANALIGGQMDNASIAGLMADPYAEGSQDLLWNLYERNNPSEKDRLALEMQRQQLAQQTATFEQGQADRQRQEALRTGQQQAVEGYMGNFEAQGGDLFDPAMQQMLRQNGISGVDPSETVRYNTVAPYAAAGDYANAFTQMAAPPDTKEGFTLGKGQIRYDANGRQIAAGPADVGDNGFTLGKGQVRYGADGKPIAQGPADVADAKAPTIQKMTIYDPETKEPVEVTMQWDQVAQDWVPIGKGPAFNPKSSVTVNNDMGGGNDNKVFDKMGERYDAVSAAKRGLVSMREAKKAIMDGAITGPGANQLLTLQRIGAFMGVMDPKVIQNTETFRSAIAPQVAAMIKATVGSTQISNTDRDFAMMAAGGDIELNQGTILRLIDIMERSNAALIDDYQARLDKVYDPNSTDPGVQRSRALYEISDEAPMPGDLVRLPEDDASAETEYAKLPSGTWFQAPDGTVRRKP